MQGLFVLLLLSLASGDNRESSHTHSPGDKIQFISDRIWPRSNPSETYSYFTLPFCPPGKRLWQSFGAELSGSASYETSYDLPFRVSVTDRLVCEKSLSIHEIAVIRHAISDNYFALFYYDDLPVKFPLGKIDESENGDLLYRLFLHLDFRMWYNGGHVVEVDVLPDEEFMFDVTRDANFENIKFTYSAKWVPTNREFHDRWEKYVSFNLFPEEIEIQWFSIMNSLILVVVLTSFVAFILRRILSRDFAYYEEEDDAETETGWKLLHGDVFRFPRNANLLASLIGNGIQLNLAVFLLLIIAVLGAFYPGYSNRAVYATLVVIYVFTSGVSGYVSGKYYRHFGGENWVRNVLLTVIMFVGPCFLTWCVLNTIALFYRSTAAFSFKLFAGIFALYFLISFPLQLVGAITAKNFGGEFNPPCRTAPVIRKINAIPWYKRGSIQFLVAGFLPFSAIYIELYYIYLSIWGHIVFTPFLVLFIFFIILMLVTCCITIAMVYIQISQEDHRWWWRAFWCGAASAFFIFGYSVFYYYVESNMEGFFQFVFYFGYNLMICYGIVLMLGSVGFLSSLVFIKRIYRGIRID